MGLVIALATRLVNLDAYTGKFDEGIRTEQLLLMSAGFRPVRDIFAAQGPLSLDIFYPTYLIFGQTLAAARVAVVLFSLGGLAAVWWTAGLRARPLGAGLAVLVLLLSPLYLKNSRLALLEVPALVPATLALGAALRFQHTAGRHWLVLSAIALALAILIKPMIIGVIVPIGLALLLRPGWRWKDLALCAGVVALIGTLVVVLYGAEGVWQQMVGYRTSARRANDWSLKENWSILSEELRDEPLALWTSAALGGLYLAIRYPRWGLPLAAWPLANFGLLLAYSPLQFKHVAILLPPAALVLGVAGADLLRGTTAQLIRRSQYGSPAAAEGAQTRRGSSRWLTPIGLLGLGLMFWYIVSLPAALRQSWRVMSGASETRVETFDEESALLAQLTSADEFVIVDDPIVAFNARRLVPPSLVDTSHYRLRSGALSGAEVVAAAERYGVRFMLLSSDGLRDLETFEKQVDARYRAIKIWERANKKDRALYLRDDGDFAHARDVLAGSLERPMEADFGGDLRLLGYDLARDELRPGASTTLTLHWEALRPMSVDYHVITYLRGSDDEPEAQSQRSLGGGGEGTSSWEAGRWVLRAQTLTVPPRTPSGEYQLSVALYDSKARSSPHLTAGGPPDATEVGLGRVRVR